MAGLLGDSMDDPGIQGLLSLGFGLMNSRGNFGQALGQAGPQALDQYNQASQMLQRRKLLDQETQSRAQQMEMAQQQLAEFRRNSAEAEAQRGRDDQFRQMIPAPTGGPATSGPTDFGNFSLPGAPADPRAAMLFQALQQKQIKPMEYLTATQKDLTPFKLGAGEVAFDPVSRQPIMSNPKEAEQPGDWKLYQLSGAPQRGIPFDQWDQARRRAGASSTSVSYGAPVAGVDKSGNPVFFQPGKDGGPPKIMSDVAPPAKEMPSAMAEKFAQNSVTLQKIDKAIALAESNPSAFGLKNVAPDLLIQRLDPDGVETRAYVADIGGQKIHDRSGGAVTVSEAGRLKPYIPMATDPPEVAKTKLKMFRREYASMQQALASGASIKAAASGLVPKQPSANDGWSITPKGQ